MSSKQAASSRTRYQDFERRYSVRSVIPPTAYRTRRFQRLAFPTLLSCFTELAQQLEQGGIRAILCADSDMQQEVGIHLPKFEASVFVRPALDCPFLQATGQAGLIHPRRLEWFIPYHFLESEAIDRELSAAVKDLIRRHPDAWAPP